MSVFFQALCTGIICYLSMSMGIIVAWPSCTVTLFESNSTTLHRAMGETELSLFGSLASVGALISTPIAGYLLDEIGRKYCAVLASLTYVIGWGLIAFSTQVEVILVAVFIAGLGASAMLIVRVYVSEICTESVRGAMTTGSSVFYSLGIMLSYALGGSLDYKLMVYVSLAISVVGVAMLGPLKESPTYLMKKGFEKEAAKSIAFYRKVSPDSKEVLQEMDTLRRAFNPHMEEDLTPEKEKLYVLETKKQPPKKLSLWKFLRTSRSTRQATLLTLILVTAGTFQGLMVIQVYAKPLFEEAVPSMSPIVCSVVQALISVVAGLVSGYLSDFAGRRALLIYSSVAAGLCCVALGTQLEFHWAPHWVTALFLYLYTISYTFGAGTVPFVLVTDVFLPEIKSVMSMVVMQWCWLCSFIMLFMFKPLVSIIGLGLVFHLFAAVCVLTVGYSIFYLPETKGLAVDAIQVLLDRRKVDKFILNGEA